MPPANDSAAESDNCAITESACPNVELATTLINNNAEIRKERRIVTKILQRTKSYLMRQWNSPLSHPTDHSKHSILLAGVVFCKHLKDESK